MRKPKVYIAGPYSNGDHLFNTYNAMAAAEWVITKGGIPYIPHLSHYWHLYFPKPYDWWLDYDLEWLQHCDVVLRLTGISDGAEKECKKAWSQGKTVIYYDSVKEFEEFRFDEIHSLNV